VSRGGRHATRGRRKPSAHKGRKPNLLSLFSEVPRLRVLLPLSLIGRAHQSALPIALTFSLSDWLGSFSKVGLATAMLAVGQGVAGPLRGRLADRGSASRLLFTSGFGYAASLIAVILATMVLPGSAWLVAVLLLFCAGLVLPPVGQISRSVWSRIAQGSSREAVFNLDATGYSLVALGGPLLASGLVATFNGAAAILACVVLALVSSIGFGLALRRFGLDQPVEKSERAPQTTGRREPSLLRDSAFVSALLLSFVLISVLYSVDLSLVSWGEDLGEPGTAGILVAFWSLGSLLGGILVSGLSRKPGIGVYAIWLAVGVGVLALLLPPVTASPSTGLLAVVAVLSGSAVSPSVAAGNTYIGLLAPEHRRTEAFGWLNTATTGGVALSLPVNGWLLDTIGPSAGLGLGALLALLAAVLGFRLPKDTAASQAADTAAREASESSPPADAVPAIAVGTPAYGDPLGGSMDYQPLAYGDPLDGSMDYQPFTYGDPLDGSKDYQTLLVGTPIFDGLYAEYRRSLQGLPGGRDEESSTSR